MTRPAALRLLVGDHGTSACIATRWRASAQYGIARVWADCLVVEEMASASKPSAPKRDGADKRGWNWVAIWRRSYERLRAHRM